MLWFSTRWIEVKKRTCFKSYIGGEMQIFDEEETNIFNDVL